MNIKKFNEIMKTIDGALIESGMSHTYTPKIATILMNNLDIVEDVDYKCTCQGFYKPTSCHVHGTKKR